MSGEVGNFMGYEWNDEDRAVLFAYYPEYGSQGVRAVLVALGRPPRTKGAVNNMAKKLGARVEPSEPDIGRVARRNLVPTPTRSKRLIDRVTQAVKPGEPFDVHDFAEAEGVNVGAVTFAANQLVGKGRLVSLGEGVYAPAAEPDLAHGF